jgi:hypothetical protein
LQTSGTVAVERPPDVLAARQGMRLLDLDTVQTGSGSSAWLSLDDAKAVELSEQTALRIDRQARGFVLTLAYGEIKTRIDRPLYADEDFVVEVGGFALSVRGTVFMVNYTDQILKVEVESGEVAVLDEQGNVLAVLGAGESGEYGMDPDTNGNSPENMANGGIVTVSGGWLYYIDYYNRGTDDNTAIYRVKADGSGAATFIASGEDIRNISVLGDWIYYIKKAVVPSSGGMKANFIFRIRLDGTEETKLFEETVNDFYAIGDWIYYSNNYRTAGLCKMQTDGTEITRLVEDDFSNRSAVQNITVIDEWIYYRRDDGRLLRIRPDGTEQTELKRQIDKFVIIDDWIYYSVSSYVSQDEVGLYKMRADGADDTRISDLGGINYLNTDGEWLYFYEQWRDPGKTSIYYASEEIYGRLHRLSLDGRDDTIISDNEVWSYNLNILDDWIYFYIADSNLNETGDKGLYRMKADGAERQKFSEFLLLTP